MIKMIATDMDQTFLDNKNQYNQDRFKEIFQEIRRQNIHFVAASGSQHERLQALFDPITDQMDFVSQNGSIIYHGNELLDVFDIKPEMVQETLNGIYENFDDKEILVNVCGLTSSYVDANTPAEVLDFIGQFYKKIETVENLAQFNQAAIKDPIVKIALGFDNSEKLTANIQKLRNILNPELSSLSSGFNTELIGVKYVDKSKALQRLMHEYDIHADELVTFGDNENDLKMLAMTPHGYAMQNAFPKVKEAAAHLTKLDNEHEGVLDILEKIL